MPKLTEETAIDQITAQWLPATPKTDLAPAAEARWVVNIRTATRILRDGEIVNTSYHRRVLEPGASTKDEDPLVAAIAKAAWKKT